MNSSASKREQSQVVQPPNPQLYLLYVKTGTPAISSPFITGQLHGLSYWMFRICFPGYAIRAISTHPLLVSGNLRTGKLWRSCDSHRMIQCPFVSSCFQPFPILQAGLPPPRREKGLPVASHCWPWRATSASGTPFPRTVSVIRLPPNTRWYWYPPANVMSNENITEGY